MPAKPSGIFGLAVTPLDLYGSASETDGRLRLTDAKANEVGSAWVPTPLSVADRFDVLFTMSISSPGGSSPDWSGDPRDPSGADGLAFVVRGMTSPPIGLYASGIGYMGIPDSLAIEFDTWVNTPEHNGAPGTDLDPYCEPLGNHIAVQTRGTLPNSARHCSSAGATIAPPYLLNAPLQPDALYLARISYEPGLLRVYWQGAPEPVITAPINLQETLQLDHGKAILGWTASTGGAWENHDVISASIYATPEPPTYLLLGLGLITLSRLHFGKASLRTPLRDIRKRKTR